jgi:aryl-alcohol dehydrogenase-like predicted oxidoreductase
MAHHRQLGSTGLTVSPIGLGLAALGRPAYITPGRGRDIGSDRSVAAMERACHQMLDAAWASGIRYIDAARSYGLAEQFLSTWLAARHLPDDAVTIGSKWGYSYVGAWRLDAPVHEIKDLSVDALRRQIGETRALLGSRLRLYQIHSATLESGVLDDRRVLLELARLQSEGLSIGLTTTGPRQADVIRRALAVDIDGVNPFQSVQSTWNLLEPSAGSALAEARERGWGVIVKEVLANGRLTAQYGGPEIQPLRDLAAARGTTVDAEAFAAALANPWVDVVLSGAVTADQLHSNLRALDSPAGPDRRLDLAEAPDAYWTYRRALRWE